ncbi:MAG: NAD-dependent epimerase/dehydratase family protein [Gaiellaceae bacterium]
MRAIVTGGAGFIGSHLVDRLVERGDDVTVVDNRSSGKRESVNPKARFWEHDIREGFYEPADVIFHLAAQTDVHTSVAKPDYDASVNVLGTVHVLEAARDAKARVVFTSTGGAIYGECERPAREDAELRPGSPYAVSKRCGEEYLATWNRLYETDHVVCRLANVYGPRQQATLEGGVVAIFLDRLRDGRETEIFGDGSQTRDFVFVEDVIGALLAAASAQKGGVYNVGSGVATSILELHRLCAETAGAEAEPRFGPARPGDLRHSVLDASRARRELGWRAETTLADGLARTRRALRTQ